MAEHTTSASIVDRFQRDLDRVQYDLRAVLRHHAPAVGWYLAILALFETTGTMGDVLVDVEPAARDELLRTMVAPLQDQLYLNIATAGERVQ